MLRIEGVKFENNRILLKLSDGRMELRHLSSWPKLVPLVKDDLEKFQVILDGTIIAWPFLKFQLKLAEILKANKR